MGKTVVKNEIDMVNGPLLKNVLRFAVPVALLSLLQITFTAADTIVLGRFAGSSAMAAVGATGSMINMLITFFSGLASGVNVMVARYRGAGHLEKVRETVHTAILAGLICGLFLLGVGALFARPLLKAMATPADILDRSALYMRIYFLGVPASLIYSYGAAALNAVGDTKRPLYFLLVSGATNVILNLFFVVGFRMEVAGVAIATVASQYAAVVLLLRCMLRTEGVCKLEIKMLKIHVPRFLEILRIGVPAGVQNAMFVFSGLLVQSAINSFGTLVISGNTAVGNIENIICVAIGACNSACVAFVSQNYGAGNLKRINQVLVTCACLSAGACMCLGGFCVLLGEPLMYLFTDDPQVVAYGLIKLHYVASLYFIYGIMDIGSCTLRGLGHSTVPAVVSIVGICGLRILWLYTVFAWHPTLQMLYLCFPVTWVITGICHYLCYFRIKKKVLRYSV